MSEINEINRILQHFNHDAVKISDAINSKDSAFETADLIRAYIEEVNELPPILVGDDIPSPDDYPELWEEESIESMKTYGDLKKTPAWKMIKQHVLGEDGSVLDRSRRFIDDVEDAGGIGPNGNVPGILDIDGKTDLKKLVSELMWMGNPGLMLNLFAMSMGKRTAEFQETITQDGMVDLLDLQEDALDEFYDIDPESQTAQAESQELSTKLQNINSLFGIYANMLQLLQDNMNDIIDRSSQMTESHYRTLSTINRNLG